MGKLKPSGPSAVPTAKLEDALQSAQSQLTKLNSPLKSSRPNPDAIPAALKKTFSKSPSPPTLNSISSNTSLGTPNTVPSSWRRGDIIRVPHLVSALNIPPANSKSPYPPADATLTPSQTLGLISTKLRYAVVISILPSNILALPIFTSAGAGTLHKSASYTLTTMSILPAADPKSHILATDNKLFVHGSWKPKPRAYINVAEPLVVQYAWPLAKTDKLDARSTALLMQRWRIMHNMGFVPRELAEMYFRAMVTREPVLAPGVVPEEEAAEEFYAGFMPGCCVVFGQEQKLSTASVNENLLVDDLGMGVVRGAHDEEAKARLVEWKPSLALVLGEEQDEKARSSAESMRIRLERDSEPRSVGNAPWGRSEGGLRQRSLSLGQESNFSSPWSDMVSPKFAGEFSRAKKGGMTKKKMGRSKTIVRNVKPRKVVKTASFESKQASNAKANASTKTAEKQPGEKHKPEIAASPTRRNPVRTAKGKANSTTISTAL